MNQLDTDKTFSGAVPAIYESHLVPLLFAPYAAELTRRVVSLPITTLLEVAAGTGAVTRQLAAALPETVHIVATDLNPAMLEQAKAIERRRAVLWQTADAMALPFEDAAFDVVVCQFGAMFFPDKPKAYAEVRRVLQPGGTLVFSVWDSLDTNDFARVVTAALAALSPTEPPRFLARTPHGYHDIATIKRDLRDGGFAATPQIETVTMRSRAASAREVAIGYCQGTPLRNEILACGSGSLEDATEMVEHALEREFGTGPVEGNMQAHVIQVGK